MGNRNKVMFGYINKICLKKKIHLDFQNTIEFLFFKFIFYIYYLLIYLFILLKSRFTTKII